MFQMLRGTLVVFAGALTIILLKRRLHVHHYFGITLITAGAALVGASRCMLCALVHRLRRAGACFAYMLSCTSKESTNI